MSMRWISLDVSTRIPACVIGGLFIVGGLLYLFKPRMIAAQARSARFFPIISNSAGYHPLLLRTFGLLGCLVGTAVVALETGNLLGWVQ